MGAPLLLATGFLKIGTTQMCLHLGWRGGHFFPLIFAGIALGYGVASLFGINPVLAICVSTATLLGMVMKQPILVVLLLFLCFPAEAALPMLVAAAIGSALPLKK